MYDENMQNENRHYTITIWLHWLSAAIVIIALISILSRELIEDDGWRSALMITHKSAGFAFLWLSVARLFLRFFHYSSNTLSSLPKNIRVAATASHLLLYALVVLVPLSGWLFSSAAGKPIFFLGLISIPSLIAKNRDIAETLGETHEFLAWGFVILIGLHTAAALWHHFILKDHTLVSMTFSKRKP